MDENKPLAPAVLLAGTSPTHQSSFRTVQLLTYMFENESLLQYDI